MFVILAIIIGFILVIFGPEIFDSPTPSVSLTKINESGIPKGKIVHLIDDDFKEFPQMAPVFRDNTQGVSYANSTRISYTVKLSWEEREKFMGSKFGQRVYNFTSG